MHVHMKAIAEYRVGFEMFGKRNLRHFQNIVIIQIIIIKNKHILWNIVDTTVLVNF